MHLTLTVNKKNISLALFREGKQLDLIDWGDEQDLSEKFFRVVDAFLAKNSITKEHITHMECDTQNADGITTARIAQTIAQTFTFAKESQKM